MNDEGRAATMTEKATLIEVLGPGEGDAEPSSRQRTAHQMQKISKEIEALVAANVPVDELRPIDVIRRIQDSMKAKGMLSRELPGTRTFYRCLEMRLKSNTAQRSRGIPC